MTVYKIKVVNMTDVAKVPVNLQATISCPDMFMELLHAIFVVGFSCLTDGGASGNTRSASSILVFASF